MNRILQPLKITLSLSVSEIIDVIECLPEQHPLVITLTEKRNVLMAAEKIRKNILKQREGN